MKSKTILILVFISVVFFFLTSCGGSGGDSGVDADDFYEEDGSGSDMANGQTLTNQSADQGGWIYETIDVPDGATNLVIRTVNGDGDADLYISYNGQPTTDDYDDNSTEVGNSDEIKISDPSEGVIHIGVYANTIFSGLNLTVSYIYSDQYGISLQEANTIIQQNSNNSDFILLDVRTPEEYNDIYIEGAENMDFYCTSFHGKFNQLDKNKKYLVYCKTQNRSSQTAMMMMENGFTDFKFIIGGITEWQAQEYSVVDGSGDDSGG